MKRAAVVLAAASLLIAGCSNQGAAEANAKLCTSLTGLSDELQTLTALVGSNATVQEMRVQLQAVESAAESADSAADDVKDAVADQLSAAEIAFQDAVDAIGPAATLQEAASAYGAAAKDFTSAVETTLGDLGCS